MTTSLIDDSPARPKRRSNGCADPTWLGYAAVDDRLAVGSIGALSSYERGWEIHPLVVAPPCQRQGIGSALLQRARLDGVLTLFLDSDDDFGGMTLFDGPGRPDIPLAMRLSNPETNLCSA